MLLSKVCIFFLDRLSFARQCAIQRALVVIMPVFVYSCTVCICKINVWIVCEYGGLVERVLKTLEKLKE